MIQIITNPIITHFFHFVQPKFTYFLLFFTILINSYQLLRHLLYKGTPKENSLVKM